MFPTLPRFFASGDTGSDGFHRQRVKSELAAPAPAIPTEAIVDNVPHLFAPRLFVFSHVIQMDLISRMDGQSALLEK